MQHKIAALKSRICSQANHVNDEEIQGFSNCSRFSDWFELAGKVLWCRLSPTGRNRHRDIGTCIMRQVVSKATTPCHLFTYNCGNTCEIRLPREYWEKKKKALEEEEEARKLDQEDNSVDHGENEAKPFWKPSLSVQVELIFLSLVMQAIHKGFRVETQRLNLESPQEFITVLWWRHFLKVSGRSREEYSSSSSSPMR